MKNNLPVELADNLFSNMTVREAELAEVLGAVRPNDDSPVRFEIIQEKLKRGDDTKTLKMIPILMKMLLGVNRSIKSIKANPTQLKTHIDQQLLAELEEYAFSLDANSIGCTQHPSQWVIQNKEALHANVIVLTMKMDRDCIDTAPSTEAEIRSGQPIMVLAS